MSNQFVWVDIPVKDLDRAISFYSGVLGFQVPKEGGPGFSFGLFPHSDGDIGGCLYLPGADNEPSKTGPLVYLNVLGRLHQAVEAVLANGGLVLKEIHELGPHGFCAIVLDSEGNRLALHAPTA
jgi:predicted enzyme related to lactoylglutathione lyase